ncbi:unnamed protein product [Acanthocheilonema viteae]|uniref:Uncharacterized protein n=1 Tax=Acanthocheilonema viteae TaxID=6277 RepID=A0A498S8F5_ACAVI|nr:unnamed protein product [Acanthocheilonema viteae]
MTARRSTSKKTGKAILVNTCKLQRQRFGQLDGSKCRQRTAAATTYADDDVNDEQALIEKLVYHVCVRLCVEDKYDTTGETRGLLVSGPPPHPTERPKLHHTLTFLFASSTTPQYTYTHTETHIAHIECLFPENAATEKSSMLGLVNKLSQCKPGRAPPSPLSHALHLAATPPP